MERKTEIFLYRWIKPHYHVVMLVTTVLMAMLLGYIVSVSTEHVNALFPYISDTGTKPPASCIFGLMLNLSSVFAFTSMFIRHRYFEKFNGLDSLKTHMVNDVCLFVGSLSAFGIMIVANFQETNQLTMHLIGAILAFALGLLYCLIQCYLSYITIPAGLSTKIQLYVKIIIIVVAAFGFVGTFAGGALAGAEMVKNNGTEHKVIRLHWKSSDPGYDAHLVSTFSEWIMVIAFIFFFLTFYNDFKYLETRFNLECFVLAGDRMQPLSISPNSNMLESSQNNERI